ncbi:HAD family hydrolase [Halorarum halobium]|uniref:HAD family hydrolase n=1 Tax=Halorarum halobium TaxID=3075121 RepID=UPI0028A60F21|nr:HAD-IB family phosphatase [Halobaculum sp. XH14]
MSDRLEGLLPDPDAIPASGPGPALVVFDFDGTLAEQRGSWGLLYRLFGVEPDGVDRTDAYWDGDLSFQSWCEGNVADWRERGVTASHLRRAAEAIKLTEGAGDLLETLSAGDVPFGVLSSGVLDLMARIETHDPAFIVSNEILYEDGVPVDVRAHVGPDDKGELLRRLCAAVDVDSEDVVYVGDSHSDVEAFEVAGTAVLFDPDDRIEEDQYDLVDHLQTRRDLAELVDVIPVPGPPSSGHET